MTSRRFRLASLETGVTGVRSAITESGSILTLLFASIGFHTESLRTVPVSVKYGPCFLCNLRQGREGHEGPRSACSAAMRGSVRMVQ